MLCHGDLDLRCLRGLCGCFSHDVYTLLSIVRNSVNDADSRQGLEDFIYRSLDKLYRAMIPHSDMLSGVYWTFDKPITAMCTLFLIGSFQREICGERTSNFSSWNEVATASQQLWSFGRDGGLPYSQLLIPVQNLIAGGIIMAHG